jgi:hypothetical protein
VGAQNRELPGKGRLLHSELNPQVAYAARAFP